MANSGQSLNIILSRSERVKTLKDTYVLFRFYEISQRDRADRISICTNSKSAVKPRDLRNYDKRRLDLKNNSSKNTHKAILSKNVVKFPQQIEINGIYLTYPIWVNF